MRTETLNFLPLPKVTTTVTADVLKLQYLQVATATVVNWSMDGT